MSVPFATKPTIRIVGVDQHRMLGGIPWSVEVEFLAIGRLFGCRYIVGKFGDQQSCRKAYGHWLRAEGCGDELRKEKVRRLVMWVMDGLTLRLVVPNHSKWIGEEFQSFLLERIEKHSKQAFPARTVK